MYTNIQWIGIADRLMTICPYRLFEYRFIFNPRMWHFCSFIRGMKENARIKHLRITESWMKSVDDRLNGWYWWSSTSVKAECQYITLFWQYLRSIEFAQNHSTSVNCFILVRTVELCLLDYLYTSIYFDALNKTYFLFMKMIRLLLPAEMPKCNE